MSRGSVMLGVSGGVDSSVAAHLLLQQGWDLAGLFMKNWEEQDVHGVCPAEQDARDAEQICAQLGIRFHARNFAAEYWDGVFEHFLAEYRAGRTPNPDILCNREIKFKTFLEHAEDLGAEWIATGHYARTEQRDGRAVLLRGRDANKDQSYFLHAISESALRRTLFPVGELEKPQVREIAHRLGLSTAKKKDSTGICFIGERDFRGFLSQYIHVQPGPIEDEAGKRIGQHQGIAFYTIGQRDGLGIGGLRDRPQAPWFVAGKDPPRNALIAVQGNDHPALMASRLAALDASWIAGAAPAQSFACTAKTRYRQADQACHVRVEGDRLEVEFESPQRAVTPGQSVVFYLDELCLGGAVIAETNAQFAKGRLRR
jgi:tRNA-uridine 2-sulfurtransferase